MRVSREWKDSSVDLAVLSKRLECFFRTKGLHTEETSSRDNFKILLSQSKRALGIYVEVIGLPSDFEVDFVLDERSDFKIMGSVLSVFLGGGLSLIALRSKELFEKLEPEFWAYVEKTIEELSVPKHD